MLGPGKIGAELSWLIDVTSSRTRLVTDPLSASLWDSASCSARTQTYTRSMLTAVRGPDEPRYTRPR